MPVAQFLALAVSLVPARCLGQEARAPSSELLGTLRSADTADPAAVAKQPQPASLREIAEMRLLLRHPDPSFRKLAVIGLASLGDRPVQALARLLDDEDKRVRAAAEESLAAAGPKAVTTLGEILSNNSCVAESVGAAARILGRIGDPGGIPCLTGVLVKYRAGGFPQRIGMEALKAIGGPPAVGQLLQLIGYRELGEEASLALMTMDRDALLRAVAPLLDDAAEDPELRFFYAHQLNEIAGSVAAAPVLVKFFAAVAEDAAQPDAIRKKGAVLRNLFGKIAEGDEFYREPLTRQALSAQYAPKAEDEDEENPYVAHRREQERKMDQMRVERQGGQRPRFIMKSFVSTGVYSTR